VIILDRQFRKRDEQFDGRPFHGGKKRFTAEDFEYDGEGNKYRCPEGKELFYKGHVKLNRNSPQTLFIADKKQEENLCERYGKR
jgi:hypothetical protein